MKLITKISLGTALVLLFFSQIFSLWDLTKSRTLILDNIKAYESRNLAEDVHTFIKKKNNDAMVRGMELGDIYLRSVFRGCFSMDAALFVDGREVYNQTPYEIDLPAAKDRRRTGEGGPDDNRIYQYEDRVGGRHLLLSFYEEKGENDIWIFCYKDVTEVYRDTLALFWQGFGIALLLILVMLLPLYWIVGRILRPFYELEQAADTIAGGDYGKRVPVRSQDEVGSLSVSFNKMADSVEAHVEELSRTNAGQQMLLGSLAHELKTPMMAIGGYAESMRRLSMTEEQKERSLCYIESECRRLSRLSAKMLELTGLYQADGQMEWEEIPVKEFFALADALAYRRISRKKIRLRSEVEPEHLTIRGDKDMLMSLILNLIDNGCKASGEGAEILLTADTEGLHVRDFGAGIPAEEVEKVTEAFYMVDKSRSRREGGAGLGLAICRQIAEAHHARLVIESRVGQGTTVSVLWE